jgi:tetratricopeptide (TPR) repeat protein
VASAAKQRERYLSPRSVADSPHAPLDQEIESIVQTQIDQLEDATTRHPHHADLHYRLGLLRRHIGDVEGAIAAYHSAVAINPNYFAALVKLGLALREAGNNKEAVGAFKRALQVDRQAIHLHYELGLIFADRGQFTLALEQFERAADGQPDKVDHAANLALCLQDMGLIDRAASTWQTLCELTEDGSVEQGLPGAVSSTPRPTR